MRVLRRVIFTLFITSLAVPLCSAGPTEYGTLTVSKVATEGAGTPFGFTSPQFGEFTLADGDSTTFQQVVPGDYTIQELPTPEWELYLVVADSTTSASDDLLDWSTYTFALHLDPGEMLGLTFHNRSLPGAPQGPAIAIPAPSALLLAAMGAGLCASFRRRRNL